MIIELFGVNTEIKGSFLLFKIFITSSLRVPNCQSSRTTKDGKEDS